MRALLRRNVSAVEGRFYKTVAIREEITETNNFFPRSSGDVTLKGFSGEKAFRRWPSPSRDHWQNRIVLKGKTNHTIWHRSGEQLLNGFPKRSDVHRTVQSEQRLLEGWIDDRYRFPSGC